MKTWNTSRTKRVCLVKVIVKTGHLVINQLEDVKTDVKITGLANFARVSFQFYFFLQIGSMDPKVTETTNFMKKKMFFFLKGPLNKSTETACQNVCTTIIDWLPTVKRLIGNISIYKDIARLSCLSVHRMSKSKLYHIFAILSQLW